VDADYSFSAGDWVDSLLIFGQDLRKQRIISRKSIYSLDNATLPRLISVKSIRICWMPIK
jgi:hypothetical protein